MVFTSSCFCKCYIYKEVSFSVIISPGTPSPKLQIVFGVVQTDIENSATEPGTQRGAQVVLVTRCIKGVGVEAVL